MINKGNNNNPGGIDLDWDPRYEIWEFEKVTEQWVVVDRMMQPRYQHAITLVSDAAQYCSSTQRISLGTLLMFLE